MVLTRSHYFSLLPDASWAVFFIAGFYLHSWKRWVFPSLIGLAVLVDWQVITAQGIRFWQHYCISIGYGCLLPAYFVMWAGGQWLQQHNQRPIRQRVTLFLLSLSSSVALCHLLAQGGFYWLSESISDPTFSGWAKNYVRWFLPYWSVALLYTSSALWIHGLVRHFKHPNALSKHLINTENN